VRRKESISRETTGKMMKYAQYLKKLTYEKLETGGGGRMAITMKVDGENTPAKQKTTRKIKEREY
jgi:NADH/NAD ratio-sensing transcriptional regulator Rex